MKNNEYKFDLNSLEKIDLDSFEVNFEKNENLNGISTVHLRKVAGKHFVSFDKKNLEESCSNKFSRTSILIQTDT